LAFAKEVFTMLIQNLSQEEQSPPGDLEVRNE
jgi:hypothetical protein